MTHTHVLTHIHSSVFRRYSCVAPDRLRQSQQLRTQVAPAFRIELGSIVLLHRQTLSRLAHFSAGSCAGAPSCAVASPEPRDSSRGNAGAAAAVGARVLRACGICPFVAMCAIVKDRVPRATNDQTTAHPGGARAQARDVLARCYGYRRISALLGGSDC